MYFTYGTNTDIIVENHIPLKSKTPKTDAIISTSLN